MQRPRGRQYAHPRGGWPIYAIALATALGTARADSLQQDFKNPPRAYAPMVRWWWPGDDVDDAELRREIDELAAAGFGGAEIQALTINLKPDMPTDTRARVYRFGTDSFFAHVRTAVEAANSHGMRIDLTFGSGWPFGGDAATPERALIELGSSETLVHGGTHYRAKLDLPKQGPPLADEIHKALGPQPPPLPPEWKERMKTREKTVAVLAARSSAPEFDGPPSPGVLGRFDPAIEKSGQIDPTSILDLTAQVSQDGVLDWDPPAGEWRLFAFRQTVVNPLVLGGAAPGPGLILDHFQGAAFDAYAQHLETHLKPRLAEQLGAGVRAVFIDSLELPTNRYWSDDFLEEFFRRRGYDLTAYLPLIRQSGYNDAYHPVATKPVYDIPVIGDAVRRDYWRTVSELITERLYEPLADWAARHDLIVRIQAHGAPADLLRLYGLGIPETEQLYAGGSFSFMKLAASAADLYGGTTVSSESFVFSGEAYQMTPEQVKINTDRLITAGVNEIIYHGYPYTYDDRPFPGWAPFALAAPLSFTSAFNGRSTVWPYIRAINDYATRLQYISRQGRSVVPIAVFYPRTGYDKAAAHDESTVEKALMNAGYAFNYLSSDGVLKSGVEDGRIITPGGTHYSLIILDNVTWLEREVAEKLSQLAGAGVPIIVIGEPPSRGGGLARLESDARAVRAAMRGVLGASRSKQFASIELAVGRLGEFAPANVRFIGGKSLPFIQKRLGTLDAFFFSNPEPQDIATDISISARGSPQLWDPWTGEITPYGDFAAADHGVTRLHLQMPAYGSALLVFDPVDRHEPAAVLAPPIRPSMVLPVGESGWKLKAVGFAADGRSITIDQAVPQLQNWTELDGLRTFAGRAAYSTRINVPAARLHAGERVLLDLGEVKDVAEVQINGQPGASITLLMRPYIADVTSLLKPGENALQVTVTNVPSNATGPRPAVIPPAFGMKPPPYGPQPAGLLGPVFLRFGAHAAEPSLR